MGMENSKNYCVIMAGGIGSRFWPLSTAEKPKQFLDILGTGRSLLQLTYDRFSRIIPAANFLVVTSGNYKDLVLSQLPEMKESQVLSEPLRRNTAPCICYATYKILSKCPDANVIVAPSDHLILKEDYFLEEVENGLRYVSGQDVLLTLGLQPNRPETGYGYIQVAEKAEFEKKENLFRVKTFTEKPDRKMAELFLETGEFYWNSGIFIWSAYSECPNISIDYGVMEKADNVYVLCADFGWSDLGTWGSLYENHSKDKSANAVSGNNVFLYETNDCIIAMPDDKTVVIQGLKDYIVVEADKTLLICKKEDEQQIRQFVADVMLKEEKTKKKVKNGASE
jgi:mannose-1-phosphate guanylyltransferase